MNKIKKYQAEYYRQRREKFASLGLCIDCGQPKEESRQKFAKCESCASKQRERSKKYVNTATASDTASKSRWIDIDDMVYPKDNIDEVLVTDRNGDVYLVCKYTYKHWEDFFDDSLTFIAWMYLPKPFEKKVRL